MIIGIRRKSEMGKNVFKDGVGMYHMCPSLSKVWRKKGIFSKELCYYCESLGRDVDEKTARIFCCPDSFSMGHGAQFHNCSAYRGTVQRL